MARKLIIAKKIINQGYKINLVLKSLSLHKTSWYRYIISKKSDKRGRPIPNFSYSKLGTKISDEIIVEKLKLLRNRKYLVISGGYKKLTSMLKRDFGFIVNHKKVYRLCKENKLLLSKRHLHKDKRKTYTNRVITKPHQTWEFDIKYGYIHGENRFFFILVYIDIFSRMIVNYHIGLHCKAKNLVGTFAAALRKAGLDLKSELIIRSDNGPQMTSRRFFCYLETLNKIEHEFIPYATPNKNAHVESFYSIVESEFIPLYYFKDIKDVYIKFSDFVSYYNNERLHGSLNNRTPQEILELYNNGEIIKGIKNLKI